MAGEATGSATGSAAGRPTPGDQTSTSAPTGEATGSATAAAADGSAHGDRTGGTAPAGGADGTVSAAGGGADGPPSAGGATRATLARDSGGASPTSGVRGTSSACEAGGPGPRPGSVTAAVYPSAGATSPGLRADATREAVRNRSARAERVGTAEPGSSAGPASRPAAAPERGSLTVGAAKAGALLDRQLTLARTRAHSTALQALGSSRFHAVADSIAVLASEVPLTPAAADTDLRHLAAAAEERLTDAIAALPLVTAGSPYNAEALIHGLSPDPSPHPQDMPWHQVRLLLRLHRYAREVLDGEHRPVDLRLLTAGQALDRHRDASEAAAAASQAARTPRIAPATAYALGVLHADQRHEVEAARFAFQQSWQKEAVGTA
ncbi:CHAD domain-containing protein [Streptomyces resistomycificus]|uniref:CHAD domain-containing protein n=2 Tax=Streptomyces resistomycificus TaxID=67356 RepID=UPI00099F086B|nr:CHAD domain-containing protein [Streptomyces resistomycificus]